MRRTREDCLAGTEAERGDIKDAPQRARLIAVGVAVAILAAILVSAASVVGILEADRAAPDLRPHADREGDGIPPTLRGTGSEEDTLSPAAAPNPGPATSKAAVVDSESGLRFLGRVVNSIRRPVTDAVVTVRLPGQPPRVVRTDGTGAYRADLAWASQLPTVAVVSATSSAGSAMAQTAVLAKRGHVRMRPLVLRRAIGLQVKVKDHEEAVPDATVWMASHPPNDFFAVLSHGDTTRRGWAQQATSDLAGLASFDSVPSGDIRLLALASGPRYGRVDVRLDSSPAHPILIQLRQAREVRVSVSQGSDDRPMAGVHLELWQKRGSSGAVTGLDWPLPPQPTDEFGITTIPMVPADQALLLVARGRDWRHPAPGRFVSVDPGQREVRIRVPEGRTMSWPLVAGNCPIPHEGTPLILSQSQRQARLFPALCPPVGPPRIEGSCLLVDGIRQPVGWWVAQTPDGRRARLDLRPDGSTPPAAFQAACSILVRVRNEDRETLAGIGVRAATVKGRLLSTTVRTDESGCALLSGLFEEVPVVVAAIPNADYIEAHRGFVKNGFGKTVVDLSEGDRTVDIVLPQPRDAVVRFTTNGKAGFPTEDFVFGVLVHPDATRPVEPRGATYDAERGEVHFRIYPPRASQVFKIYVSTPKSSPLLEPLEDRGADRPLEASIAITRTHDLVLEWDPSFETRPPYLERLVDGEWVWCLTGAPTQTESEEGHQVTPVPVGTYRLHSGVADRATEAVVVSSSAQVRLLRLRSSSPDAQR